MCKMKCPTWGHGAPCPYVCLKTPRHEVRNQFPGSVLDLDHDKGLGGEPVVILGREPEFTRGSHIGRHGFQGIADLVLVPAASLEGAGQEIHGVEGVSAEPGDVSVMGFGILVAILHENLFLGIGVLEKVNDQNFARGKNNALGRIPGQFDELGRGHSVTLVQGNVDVQLFDVPGHNGRTGVGPPADDRLGRGRLDLGQLGRGIGILGPEALGPNDCKPVCGSLTLQLMFAAFSK